MCRGDWEGALNMFWTTKFNPFFPWHSVEWNFKYEHVAIGLTNVAAPGFKTILRRLDVGDSVEYNPTGAYWGSGGFVVHEAKESGAYS